MNRNKSHYWALVGALGVGILILLVLINREYTPLEDSEIPPEVVAQVGDRAEEVEGVGDCFAAYKAAILDMDGEAAVELVTERTIATYQEQVDWALTAPRETIESLSLVNRIGVLSLRHRIPKEVLKKLTGRTAFAYAVDRDWIGRTGVIRTRLGEVFIAENTATAEVYAGGLRAPTRFEFLKENGKWRFDLIQSMRDADALLTPVLEQRGLSETELIFATLERSSGRRVGEDIWIPIVISEAAE